MIGKVIHFISEINLQRFELQVILKDVVGSLPLLKDI